MNDPQKQYGEWNKPVSKRYVLHVYIFMTFSKRQMFSDREQISGCLNLEVGRECHYKGLAEGRSGEW